MTDDLGYTPGSGASVATDNVGGRHYQRMKIVTGADGVVTGDVSPANPLPVEAYGEVVEAIEALRMAVAALSRGMGLLTVDTAGRVRMAVDAITANLTLTTVGTLSNITAGTITSVGTTTNQAQMGGYSANDQIPALMNMRAEVLRRNVIVT